MLEVMLYGTRRLAPSSSLDGLELELLSSSRWLWAKLFITVRGMKLEHLCKNSFKLKRFLYGKKKNGPLGWVQGLSQIQLLTSFDILSR